MPAQGKGGGGAPRLAAPNISDGAAIGAVIAIVTVRHRADNLVTGLTANIVAEGLTSYQLLCRADGALPDRARRARGTWPHVENAGGHWTAAAVGPVRPAMAETIVELAVMEA